jgi:hypothetical protein
MSTAVRGFPPKGHYRPLSPSTKALVLESGRNVLESRTRATISFQESRQSNGLARRRRYSASVDPSRSLPDAFPSSSKDAKSGTASGNGIERID